MKIFTNDFIRRRFASIFKRRRALMKTASGHTSVSVAEDRSLTTSACVSLARFAEPIFLSLLKTRLMVPRCLALQFPLW